MPISHKHKAIFVHIPKTAGTSVEAVLGMHGDRHDIGVVPYFNQLIDHDRLYGGQLQHLTASAIRRTLNDDAVFNAYYKFAIVRNPWDRLVSALAWTDQKWAKGEVLAREEFDQKVRHICAAVRAALQGTLQLVLPAYVYPQCLYVRDENGSSLVDFVARYENLAADWRVIDAKLRVNVELPLRMKSHHGNYREYYTMETRRLVEETYADDVSALQYDF